MTEKLNIRQLFADAFEFLRGQTPGLLAPLLIAVIGIYALSFLTQSTPGWLSHQLLTEVMMFAVTATIGAVAYRRVVQAAPSQTLLRSAGRLGVADFLVHLLFGILAMLVIVLLAMFSGIILAIREESEFGAIDDLSDIYELIAGMSTSEGFMLIALVVIAALGLFWLSMRLVLFGIATIAYERIMIFRTWSWTKGHAFRISIFMTVLMLPIWGAVLFGSRDDAANLTPWHPVRLILDCGVFILAFLLGHAGSVAIFKQLAPDVEDYETAFS